MFNLEKVALIGSAVTGLIAIGHLLMCIPDLFEAAELRSHGIDQENLYRSVQIEAQVMRERGIPAAGLLLTSVVFFVSHQLLFRFNKAKEP